MLSHRVEVFMAVKELLLEKSIRIHSVPARVSLGVLRGEWLPSVHINPQV